MKATLAVAAAAFLYFVAFRTYGFQVEDEGTLLFSLDRVLGGQMPYVDFHTGYTPGFFYLGAALLKLAGGSANNLRIFIALVNATSAAALYALARRLTGPWTAAIAPALWVAFIPTYPGDFASFNIPYPAWFATLAWLALALVLLHFAEQGRLRDVALAGLAAAVAFAIKPNAGAFALAAATWVVVGATRNTNAADRALGVLATLVMAFGVWFAFGLTVWSMDALLHLVPLAAIAALACGPMAARYATAAHPRSSRALTVLAASFATPTALWAIPVLLRLGAHAFATDVLLIGSGAAQLYYQVYPDPEIYAVAAVLLVCAVVVSGALVRRWYVSPVTLLVLAALAAGATAWFVASRALMPESLPLSISLQLENASFWLAPLVNWGGIAMLALSTRRLRPIGDEVRLAVLATSAAAMYWQLYPRIDFMHVINAAPITIVLAVWLLSRVAEWWREGAWPASSSGRAIVDAGIALGVIGIVALEAGPMLAAGARAMAAPLVVDMPRLRVRIEEAVADDLRAFGNVAQYLVDHAESGEAALPFPATAGLLFAAGLTNPVPHDYWFPGRPSHEDETRMLEALRARPPRLIATLNEGWTFFIDAPEYFQDIRGWVTTNYRLVARAGRFDVLGRADVVASLPSAMTLPEPATARDAADPWLPKRRQNARRWMAHVTPVEAAEARLPDDPRTAILLLRALRDGGDLKGARWLVGAYSSKNPRIRREAESAMERVAQDFEARRFRWADDLDLRSYRSFLEPLSKDVELLAKSDSTKVRKFAAEAAYVLAATAKAEVSGAE